jgi:glycosyltransferase involved in cell wall biosynthesis
MGVTRPLRICSLGNANNVAVQINTRCFARRGHQVAILSPVPAETPDIELLAPASGHATALQRAASYWQMIRLLRRWDPDVVVVHFASLPFNWLLPLVWFKPLAVTLAGADILFHQRPGLSPRRQRATVDLLGIADCVISRSDYMVAPYPHLAPKTIVTPWGVDVARFANAAAPTSGRFTRAGLRIVDTAPIVFSPRRLVPICNVGGIVEAMTEVRTRVPGAVLVAIDDQPDPRYKREVLEAVDRRRLAEAIRWIDAVDHDDMPALFRLADVSVSVARSDGISSAVLESMAARTPVVLGDIPNYGGIFADRTHCRMVDPRDPGAIAAGIVDVLSDAHLRATMVENGYAKVAEYGDLARETERLEAKLREIVNARPRRLHLGARARHAWNLALLAVEPDGRR